MCSSHIWTKGWINNRGLFFQRKHPGMVKLTKIFWDNVLWTCETKCEYLDTIRNAMLTRVQNCVRRGKYVKYCSGSNMAWYYFCSDKIRFFFVFGDESRMSFKYLSVLSQSFHFSAKKLIVKRDLIFQHQARSWHMSKSTHGWLPHKNI